MAKIISFALLLWWLVTLLCGFIWIDAHRDFTFWPVVLMLFPIVNVAFLFILVKRFVPREFFSIRKLTEAFKKQDDKE